MWTALLLLCLITTLDVSVARNPHRAPALDEQWNSAETNVENLQGTVRLPRKFVGRDSRVRNLHIENQTGLDGKVRKISIDSAEEKPGIRAYGLPKKNLEASGLIERVPLEESRFDGDPRSGRLVEAYGMAKERLDTNGNIERVAPAVLARSKASENTEARVPRSIGTETENEVREKSDGELDDLEAQDAKVFRPLFVYRQQQAEKLRRNRAKNQIPRYYYSANYKPWPEHQRLY